MSDNAPAQDGQGSTSAALSASAPPASAAPAGSAPVSAAVPWLGETDEATTGYVQNKGWQNPADAIKSYQNLEKLLGADKAGNAVILPKADSTPEERAAFFNRLGRPVDAEGYKIDIPEGGNKDFAKAAAAKFHELGLTQQQGEALAQWNNEQMSQLQTQTVAQKQQAFEADQLALKNEWGAAFAQNLANAQAAMRGLGLDAQTVDTLASALGHKATMNLLNSIGAKTMESSFVSGDRNTEANALTPAQAKDQIRTLHQDKTFIKRYLAKEADAVKQMARLHQFAYPE